jgi:hypothetical protein
MVVVVNVDIAGLITCARQLACCSVALYTFHIRIPAAEAHVAVSAQRVMVVIVIVIMTATATISSKTNKNNSFPNNSNTTLFNNALTQPASQRRVLSLASATNIRLLIIGTNKSSSSTSRKKARTHVQRKLVTRGVQHVIVVRDGARCPQPLLNLQHSVSNNTHCTHWAGVVGGNV